MHTPPKIKISVAEALIVASLFSLSLGQLSAIIKFQGINFYLFDLMIALSTTYFGVLLIIKKKLKLDIRFLLFFLLAFYGIIFTTFQIFYYPIPELLKVIFYLLRFVFYFLFSYMIFQLMGSKILHESRFINILKLNFFFLAILNLGQLLFFRDLSFIAVYGWDPHQNRLTGAFLDPNFMAFYLCLYYVLNELSIRNKIIEYLSIISVFLTVSRNGILTLLIIFFIPNLSKWKKILPLILVSLIVLLASPNLISRFAGFSDTNDSSYLRIDSWEQAIKINFLNGWGGVGINNYKNFSSFFHLSSIDEITRNSATSTDSSVLFIITTLGIVGFLIFVVFLGSYLVNIYNIAVISGLVFNSMFINSLFYPQTAVLLFMVLGGGIFWNKIPKNPSSQNP